MDKKDVKKILMSMRTPENEAIVNNLLGRIDLLTDERMRELIGQIGDDWDSIRNALEEKIESYKFKEQRESEHFDINKMFKYGVTINCIHLHMPVDLHEMIKARGVLTTIDIVHLYLLDAIEKLRQLQNDGCDRLQGKKILHMISPILASEKELEFLRQLEFKTALYKRKDLQDADFVSIHPEAQLANKIFKGFNVGSARIGMDVINTPEWQEKRKSLIDEFTKKGITLNDGSNREHY